MNTVLRLRRPVDVRAALRNGAKAGGPGVLVHARRREDGDDTRVDGRALCGGDAADAAAPSRVTVVAGRRLGNAVTRNRAKRRLRAAVREIALPAGFDLVLIARPESLTADYSALRRTVATAVTRAVARAGWSR